MARVKNLSIDWSGVRTQVRDQMRTGANLRVLTRATEQAAQAQVVHDITKTMALHFGNALTQIHDYLRNPGVTGIRRSGVRRISLNSLLGGSIRASTPVSWAPLNQDYAATKPPSVTFWKKHGTLSQLYQAEMVAALNAKPKASRVRAGLKGGKKRLSLDFSIRLATLPDPLGLIIGQAFVEETPRFHLITRGFSSDDRETILRITFPEAKRPVISAIAARLGRDMYAAVRKLGRP